MSIDIPHFIETDLINKYFSVEIKVTEKKNVRKLSVSQVEAKKEVVLFDDKRSRNFTIMLSRFSVTSSELYRILDTYDTNVLSISEIDMITNLMPTPEEEKLLKEFKGDFNELAKPEKYLIRVSHIIYLDNCHP
jgi:hypothetical protein